MKWYAFTTCMVIPAVLSTSAVTHLLAQDQPTNENAAVEAPADAPAEAPASEPAANGSAPAPQQTEEPAEPEPPTPPAQQQPEGEAGSVAPQRPARPTPTNRPAGASQPAATQSGESLSATGGTPAPVLTPDGKILFHFQNASLESVLIYLSETAGLTIINDVKVAGRVNVFNRQPMTISDALDVLNTVLKDQGYAAVRQGKTLRVIPLDAAKKATIPVHTGGDPLKIAISDEIITQVIPVRYANATQLKNDLAPLIPTYADLSSNASTNTLILTDTSANVRRIVEIIAALDTSLSSVTSVKVFTLQYANASNAARLVTEVFKPDTPTTGAQGNRPGVARFFQGRGAANQQQQQEGGPQTRVVASADDRTNTLVVSAPQDLMPLIGEVLKDLDANPAQDQAVFVYYLRNAQASNVQNVINSLFGTTGSTGTRTGTTNTATQRGSSFNTGFGTRSGTTSGNTNLGLSNIGTGSRGTGTTANRTTANRNTGTTARTTAAAAGRISAGAAQTAADLSGQVFAVADADTNSVLIMTASGNFDRVKELLKELDRPVPQVLIKALLTEVTHSNNTDIGLEFSALNLTSNGNTSVGTDFGVAGITTGGLLVKAFEADFSVAFAALQRVGKLDVLSRPYILASDNQTASIIVGQRVPFINNSRITDNGQTINTITYEDIGIILNVTPHINPDGLVIMDVAPEISSVTGDSVPISDNASAPVFAKRSAQTRVAIQNGQTIVIGGMMQDQKTKTVRKVPLLGDLPLVGYLFQRDQTDVSKTELLIFLTPHVASLPEMLQEMSDGETSRAKIVPKAVAPGVYDEHMRGLQRGVTPEDMEEGSKASPAEKVGPADR